MTSGDSRPVPRPLRRKAQAREALAEFSESVHTGSIAAESAFGPAEGAHKRAEARRINLAHFAAHVLLLGLMLALLGSGLAYVALFPWLSGTVSTSWLQATSGDQLLRIALVQRQLRRGGALMPRWDPRNLPVATVGSWP